MLRRQGVKKDKQREKAGSVLPFFAAEWGGSLSKDDINL
jgi:hypothetical protein